MNREKALETVLVLALASLLAYLSFEITWLLYISIGFLVAGILFKKLSLLIGKVWMSFAHYFGQVMNYVIMFIIFYFFLMPISFFQRLMGSNEILKKKEGNSHFYKRNHLFSEKDIQNPW